MTRLERRLAELEAELDAARTASELKVAARYFLQIKAAVARERATALRSAASPNRDLRPTLRS